MIDKNFIQAVKYIPNLLQRPSAWIGHLPFAYWLVKELNPKCLVELGTHYGHSYFSFCEAVSAKNEDAKFYAVDTWQGDEHAGIYDSIIYDEVKKNNEKYAKFSTLMKMTFDEAANNIENGSVDILHIDGLHTYDAVKHDFEKWFPKLRAGALVLFHDTTAREKDFGVWKFWAEICDIYPNNIEFLHSYGLGVVQLNNCKEENLLNWLKPGSSEGENVKEYFGAIGMHQMNRYRSYELEQQIHELNINISEIKKNNEGRLADLILVIERQDIFIKQRESEINSVSDEIFKIINSKSWRYTSGFRYLSNLFRRYK